MGGTPPVTSGTPASAGYQQAPAGTAQATSTLGQGSAGGALALGKRHARTKSTTDAIAPGDLHLDKRGGESSMAPRGARPAELQAGPQSLVLRPPMRPAQMGTLGAGSESALPREMRFLSLGADSVPPAPVGEAIDVQAGSDHASWLSEVMRQSASALFHVNEHGTRVYRATSAVLGEGSVGVNLHDDGSVAAVAFKQRRSTRFAGRFAPAASLPDVMRLRLMHADGSRGHDAVHLDCLHLPEPESGADARADFVASLRALQTAGWAWYQRPGPQLSSAIYLFRSAPATQDQAAQGGGPMPCDVELTIRPHPAHEGQYQALRAVVRAPTRELVAQLKPTPDGTPLVDPASAGFLLEPPKGEIPDSVDRNELGRLPRHFVEHAMQHLEPCARQFVPGWIRAKCEMTVNRKGQAENYIVMARLREKNPGPPHEIHQVTFFWKSDTTQQLTYSSPLQLEFQQRQRLPPGIQYLRTSTDPHVNDRLRDITDVHDLCAVADAVYREDLNFEDASMLARLAKYLEGMNSSLYEFAIAGEGGC